MGFFFKILMLTGLGKKPAVIEFKTGLNLIAGPSDTGKSFIFQCLDFMIGAQKSPKPIQESKGYDKVTLEIETDAGDTYTLERAITGGPFVIKEGGINSDALGEIYLEKMTPYRKNISSFLLSLCDMEEVQLRKNANNQKVNLSFRDIAGLCMVDEATIIKEESPVYHSGESVTRTKEQSLFYFLLAGNDAAGLAETEDPKVLKNKIAGKVELIRELMQRTQTKLDEYKGQNVEQLEKELDAQYEQLNFEYRTTLTEADNLRNQKSEYFKNLEKLESKRLFNKELFDRFSLLDKHYLSDKNRLEFISEGSFLLNQLNVVNCPLCGSAFDESHFEHMAIYKSENETFDEALAKELSKINTKQTELSATITKLKDDITKGDKSMVKVKEKITEIDSKLNDSLTPVTQSLRERLQILSDNKARIVQYRSLRAELVSYNDQLSKLNEQASKKIQSNDEAQAKQTTFFNEFCETVEQVLNEWKYPDITSLTFDNQYKTFDININNNPRSTSGKGYRAITYTAFVYGLMKYAIAKGLKHPKFLVIDSPLTTFKDRDGAPGENDKVDKNVESAFFESLSKVGENLQVIVLENKEPDTTLSQNIHHIHFTKSDETGRYGFFEVTAK